jgi:ABC-type Na+ efflux pump permease subunit
MRPLAKVVLAVVLAPVLMACWMGLANIFGWGVFTGWGMAHGGFVIALPICLVAAVLIVFLGARVFSNALRAGERRSQRHW